MKFLSVDGHFKKLYEQINYLSFNSENLDVSLNFELKDLNKLTMDKWKYSQEHLAMISGEQLQKKKRVMHLL